MGSNRQVQIAEIVSEGNANMLAYIAGARLNVTRLAGPCGWLLFKGRTARSADRKW